MCFDVLHILCINLDIGYGLMPHASHALIFFKNTQISRLGGGLVVCPITICQGSGS